MKRRSLVAGILVALALGHAASAQPLLSAGRRLAAARCGGCHAVDRTGQSPNPRAPRFRDLGARYPLDDLREALAEGMIVGHPALMPREKLTPPEIDDLIGYMKTLQRPAQSNRGMLRPAK